jgi:hypothetical protein
MSGAMRMTSDLASNDQRLGHKRRKPGHSTAADRRRCGRADP